MRDGEQIAHGDADKDMLPQLEKGIVFIEEAVDTEAEACRNPCSE
jgi:hypothetical protein